MINKFTPAWQITRVKARDIKDPWTKLKFVTDWLDKYPTYNNYQRVLNWVRMTGLPYSDPFKTLYHNKANELTKKSWTDNTVDDMDFKNFDINDLTKVFKDLRARKYGFQFKTPQSHIKFVTQLKVYLVDKGIDIE